MLAVGPHRRKAAECSFPAPERISVEGTAGAGAQHATPSSILEAYGAKCDRDYQVGQNGELTVVRPRRVRAWRTAGWAGRDSFRATGRWDFNDPQ